MHRIQSASGRVMSISDEDGKQADVIKQATLFADVSAAQRVRMVSASVAGL